MVLDVQEAIVPNNNNNSNDATAGRWFTFTCPDALSLTWEYCPPTITAPAKKRRRQTTLQEPTPAIFNQDVVGRHPVAMDLDVDTKSRKESPPPSLVSHSSDDLTTKTPRPEDTTKGNELVVDVPPPQEERQEDEEQEEKQDQCADSPLWELCQHGKLLGSLNRVIACRPKNPQLKIQYCLLLSTYRGRVSVRMLYFRDTTAIPLGAHVTLSFCKPAWPSSSSSSSSSSFYPASESLWHSVSLPSPVAVWSCFGRGVYPLEPAPPSQSQQQPLQAHHQAPSTPTKPTCRKASQKRRAVSTESQPPWLSEPAAVIDLISLVAGGCAQIEAQPRPRHQRICSITAQAFLSCT